ncbi:class I SAM-dependent methyltransferase [Micromonospora thermarum]|uniref:Class I SAM-dependent methyltransferase n=1 Tax=Micromonospora thermarum TaxID=2720024 RepID=A0ABX0Z813_9ACTN|nr:class I SAM-dependent methyltransferase [Micromonospora thermarum]NJP33962.1 class I SAM-dependent methyltransferase [Micromonospora thermarum]
MDVFGEVADSYDDVRPGYPPELADAIHAYHGGRPETVVEIGAGTGKGTAVLLRLGAPVTCLEPDPRMAAVLADRHPGVTVVGETFERWRPPAGGVPLLAAALSWHWLDPATRNRRAHDALTPGGTLAVLGHCYDYADPDHARAIDAALRAIDPTATQRPLDWFRDDIAGSGLFADLKTHRTHRDLPLSTERYLRLVRTFGPYRLRPPEQRARGDAALRSLVDGLGGTVVLRLRTTLVLARRPR